MLPLQSLHSTARTLTRPRTWLGVASLPPLNTLFHFPLPQTLDLLALAWLGLAWLDFLLWRIFLSKPRHELQVREKWKYQLGGCSQLSTPRRYPDIYTFVLLQLSGDCSGCRPCHSLIHSSDYAFVRCFSTAGFLTNDVHLCQFPLTPVYCLALFLHLRVVLVSIDCRTR